MGLEPMMDVPGAGDAPEQGKPSPPLGAAPGGAAPAAPRPRCPGPGASGAASPALRAPGRASVAELVTELLLLEKKSSRDGVVFLAVLLHQTFVLLSFGTHLCTL